MFSALTFFRKHWGYITLALITWALSFLSVLFIVLKTYTYLPSFFTSMIAGSFLVVGGFISRYLCFWGWKVKKMFSWWVPLLVWVGAVVLFFLVCFFFPDPQLTVDYMRIAGPSAFLYTPWHLNVIEFLFALWFLFLLLISRRSFTELLKVTPGGELFPLKKELH